MLISKLSDSEADTFNLFAKPNRSLTPAGRLLWLALMASTTMLVAVAGFAIGAWLILPFAGLEIALVWVAFRFIAQHDGDYETLTVGETNFKWEQRCGRCTDVLEGNKYWATFEPVNIVGRSEMRLRYAGKTIVVGKHFAIEEQKQLTQRLEALFGRN